MNENFATVLEEDILEEYLEFCKNLKIRNETQKDSKYCVFQRKFSWYSITYTKKCDSKQKNLRKIEKKQERFSRWFHKVTENKLVENFFKNESKIKPISKFLENFIKVLERLLIIEKEKLEKLIIPLFQNFKAQRRIGQLLKKQIETPDFFIFFVKNLFPKPKNWKKCFRYLIVDFPSFHDIQRKSFFCVKKKPQSPPIESNNFKTIWKNSQKSFSTRNNQGKNLIFKLTKRGFPIIDGFFIEKRILLTFGAFFKGKNGVFNKCFNKIVFKGSKMIISLLNSNFQQTNGLSVQKIFFYSDMNFAYLDSNRMSRIISFQKHQRSQKTFKSEHLISICPVAKESTGWNAFLLPCCHLISKITQKELLNFLVDQKVERFLINCPCCQLSFRSDSQKELIFD